LPLDGADGNALDATSDAGVDVDALLTLIYGVNGQLTGEVRRTVREALGKSIVASVADVRTITMALDRQKFPTPVSVRFARSDLGSALINGISFPVDRHDASVSVPGAATGSWEPHLVACFRWICRRGSIAFDIGANVGYHALMLAKLVGAEGTCYAFEPNSENCRLILLGAEQNQFANVKLMPIALSDRPGWAYFSPHIGSNGGFATRGAELSDGSGVVVPVFVLDDLQLPPPDLIKIDVEGAEYRVLKGAEKSIGRGRPAIISEFSLEMTGRVSGVPGAQYLEWIASLQYDIFLLDRITSQLVGIPSLPSFLSTWGSLIRIEDLLFMPHEKAHLLESN
jgi:FkbM family methyltransferase